MFNLVWACFSKVPKRSFRHIQLSDFRSILKLKNSFAGPGCFRGLWEMGSSPLSPPLCEKNTQIQNNICSNNAFVHCFHSFEMPCYTLCWKRTSPVWKEFYENVGFCCDIHVTSNWFLCHFSLDVQRMNVMELKTLFNSKIINNKVTWHVSETFLYKMLMQLHTVHSLFSYSKPVWPLSKISPRKWLNLGNSYHVHL